MSRAAYGDPTGMANVKNAPLVWVKWVDTHEFDGWKDVDKAIDLALSAKMVCESCGWLIAETDDRIVVVCHRDVEFEKVDNIWVIPRVAIVEWCDIIG